MKLRITAAFLLLLAFIPLATADHVYGRGAYASAHQWARYYADTALQQVRLNRIQHCNYYGQRWSTSYYDHLNWALRVSRGLAQSEINQRERDLRICRDRHGGYFRDYGHARRDYGHARRDYGHARRDYGHARRDYGHSRPDYSQSRRDYARKHGHQLPSYGQDRRDGRNNDRDRDDERSGQDGSHDRRRGG